MTVQIFHREGETPGNRGCLVRGFHDEGTDAPTGWRMFASYEMYAPAQFAASLVTAIQLFGADYSDVSFGSPVPESAYVVAGLVDTLLARSEYSKVPYTSRTRPWRSDTITEVTRRFVPMAKANPKEP